MRCLELGLSKSRLLRTDEILTSVASVLVVVATGGGKRVGFGATSAAVQPDAAKAFCFKMPELVLRLRTITAFSAILSHHSCAFGIFGSFAATFAFSKFCFDVLMTSCAFCLSFSMVSLYLLHSRHSSRPLFLPIRCIHISQGP